VYIDIYEWLDILMLIVVVFFGNLRKTRAKLMHGMKPSFASDSTKYFKNGQQTHFEW